MASSNYRKLADLLWPIAGLILGLILMPVAISQYPDFFNHNPLLLPISVLVVVACWMVPLFLHERASRIYKWIWSRGIAVKILSLIAALLVLTVVISGSIKLFRFHSRHLEREIAAEAIKPNTGTAKAELILQLLPDPHTDTDTSTHISIRPNDPFTVQIINQSPIAADKVNLKIRTSDHCIFTKIPNDFIGQNSQTVQNDPVAITSISSLAPISRKFSVECPKERPQFFLYLSYWCDTCTMLNFGLPSATVTVKRESSEAHRHNMATLARGNSVAVAPQHPSYLLVTSKGNDMGICVDNNLVNVAPGAPPLVDSQGYIKPLIWFVGPSVLCTLDWKMRSA